MSKYPIIHRKTKDFDPCCWQAQERVWLFFWRNMCGATSSATTQGNHILIQIAERGQNDE